MKLKLDIFKSRLLLSINFVATALVDMFVKT